jgi:alkylhydroperoxidase family enzyme
VYWKDDEKIEKLIAELARFNIKGIDKLWICYAEELTLSPSSKKTETLITQLKTSGADDRSILDATLVIGYFNFVNRIILGLGVYLEDDGGKGYKYQ